MIPRRVPLLPPFLLLVGLFVAGCGDGGSRVSTPTATDGVAVQAGEHTTRQADDPLVSDLAIVPLTPERIRRTVGYEFLVTIADRNRDLVGGIFRFRNLATQVLTEFAIAPENLIPIAGSRAVRYQARYAFRFIRSGQFHYAISVVDAAGHHSNEVAFFLTISRQVPSGTAGGEPSGPEVVRER
jgi:hypothetical protein